MLIYSKERYVPTDVNMLVLKSVDEEERYFYVHRALYDQAVIINDIYGDDVSALIMNLTGKEESRADVDYFMAHVPSPVNILGPFLLLVDEQLTKFSDMVGAIHVMSGPVNLRKLLKIPMDIRNTPTFSLSIKEEYELAWNRFFMTTMPFVPQTMQLVPIGYAPMNGTATVTTPDASANSGSDVEEDVVEIDVSDMLGNVKLDDMEFGELNYDDIFNEAEADLDNFDFSALDAMTASFKEDHGDLIPTDNVVLDNADAKEPEPEPAQEVASDTGNPPLTPAQSKTMREQMLNGLI